MAVNYAPSPPFFSLIPDLTRGGRDGLQETVFEWLEGLGTRGRHPEPFGQGIKTFPKRTQVPSDAYQGAICPVANLESSCGQADSACGQTISSRGQPCVLASILCAVDAKTYMNWRKNTAVMTPRPFFGHEARPVWPWSETCLAMERSRLGHGQKICYVPDATPKRPTFCNNTPLVFAVRLHRFFAVRPCQGA